MQSTEVVWYNGIRAKLLFVTLPRSDGTRIPCRKPSGCTSLTFPRTWLRVHVGQRSLDGFLVQVSIPKWSDEKSNCSPEMFGAIKSTLSRSHYSLGSTLKSTWLSRTFNHTSGKQYVPRVFLVTSLRNPFLTNDWLIGWLIVLLSTSISTLKRNQAYDYFPSELICLVIEIITPRNFNRLC